MNVTIEIPEDRAARFQKQAQARGLTLDRWLLELADQNAPAAPTDKPKRTFADVCAKVRGLADDLDFSRDPFSRPRYCSMSALLLDTNIPSESIRSRPDPKLDAWIHGQDDKTLHLSFVTIGELRKGRSARSGSLRADRSAWPMA
jgi:hypothetical protein